MKKNILLVFISAFGIYILSAYWLGEFRTPATSYFDDLARSFLQGRLYLENPSSTYDLTLYQGRWYVPFLPLPSFLMLPWIALFGSINTVIFSAFMGALNTVLVLLIVQNVQGAIATQADNLWLVALFGIGSVHWYISTVGTVWFISQICTVTFMALSVWLAMNYKKPFLAGLSLGIAMWARPHVVLMFPLLLGIGLYRVINFKRWILLSSIPILLSVIGIMTYNWMRFNSVTDFGYLTENVSMEIRDELLVYGQFHLHYVPENIHAMLLALPEWTSGVLLPNALGMSIFITSPAFLFLAKTRRSPIELGSWASILLIAVPLLTYYNTGWYQFGYRFSLDFIIPIMVLLASRGPVSGLLKFLIAAGVVINLWGLWWWYSI